MLFQTVINLQQEAATQELPGNSQMPSVGFGRLISQVFQLAMLVGALMVLFYFIWGAIDWISSQGDKGKLEAARNKMIHAALGLIVLASVFALFSVLQQLLGICVFEWNGVGCGSAGTPPPLPSPGFPG